MTATDPAEEVPELEPAWVVRVRVAAYAVLAIAVVVTLLSWAGVLLVFGDHVVPTWVGAPVLVLVATAARMALWLSGQPGTSFGGRWRWVLPSLTAAAWVLVPATALVGVVGGPSYVVAEPAGSDGCRAVIEETAFLFAGSGSVHVAGGWGPFAPEVGSYRTDDGLRPATNGKFTVEWSEQFGGYLHVNGTLPTQGDSGFVFTC